MKKKRGTVFLAMILSVFLSSATSGATNQDIPKNLFDLISQEFKDFSFSEIYSETESRTGETYYFFIPQTLEDKNQYAYVYDTQLNRILIFPKDKNLISRNKYKEINREDWIVQLNKIFPCTDQSFRLQKTSEELDFRQTQNEDSTEIKIINITDDWIKFSFKGRHIILPMEFMIERAIEREDEERNISLGQEIVDKHTPLPYNYVPDDLVKVDQKWNYHMREYSKYLRRHVASVIEQMLQNAEEQGIHIRIFSAYRSFEKQRYLYLREISSSGWNQNKVAKPGHSEHQLGTTVDLCGLDPGTVLHLSFDLTREGRWLKENAPKFGFHQSYTEENKHETGYMPEPWHYRFMGVRQNASNKQRIASIYGETLTRG